MKIGFTGTQRGMTESQFRQCRAALKFFMLQEGKEFHHGDCVGADVQAAEMAKQLGYKVICHPPSIAVKRAFAPSDVTLEPKPYLERNHDIVDACEILIAAPRTAEEQLRSGTWATIRYASTVGVQRIILEP